MRGEVAECPQCAGGRGSIGGTRYTAKCEGRKLEGQQASLSSRRERNGEEKMKTKALIPALLVTCGLAVSGCETLTETFAFDAIPRATFGDTVIGEAAKKEWKITDRIILSYADDVEKFMRMRMSGKRVLRKASASIQVMTAAIATALAGFGGPAAVIAGFAGVSAIIPEFQSIFQAAGGAEAFGRGAELIGDAKTEYVIAISKKGGQVQGALTPEGAALYKRVVASIVVVERALLQQIPTRKQIEDAEGNFKRAFERKLEAAGIDKAIDKAVAIEKLKALIAKTKEAGGDTTELEEILSKIEVKSDEGVAAPAETETQPTETETQPAETETQPTEPTPQ